MTEYISKSEQETQNIAKEFAHGIKSGDVVLLVGDLGAGKTAFVKGVAEYFGYHKSDVVSPTFTIVNTYKTPKINIYHFDLYRIESPEELFNIGIEEYFYGDGICFIEWPERATELLPKQARSVEIFKLGQNQRKIVIGEQA